jgi:hypothetical protein
MAVPTMVIRPLLSVRLEEVSSCGFPPVAAWLTDRCFMGPDGEISASFDSVLCILVRNVSREAMEKTPGQISSNVPLHERLTRSNSPLPATRTPSET